MPSYPAIPIVFGARVRPSPFFEATLEYGVGAFTVYNHMLMPAWYESVESDYHHLLSGVTVWDVGVERQVEITGPDAASFTQYLVTRDVRKIAPGTARYTLVCQEDGGILNDPVLLRLSENHFWLSLADSDILLWAKGVAHGSEFDVTILEPDVSPVQVQGPRSADLMRPLFGQVVDELAFYHFIETQLDGVPVVLSRTGWSGEFGYEVFLRDGSKGTWLWERLFEAGAPFGVRPGAPNNIRRMEAGLFSYGTDMNSSTNPFELGLGKFVSLAVDDDFIGKEALREVVRHGPVRSMVGLLLDGEPIRQGPLRWWQVSLGEAAVGHVTSATWSPGMESNIGYGLLDAGCTDSTETLTVDSPDGVRQATITSLPFVQARY